MAEKFTVKQQDKLLNFLFKTLKGWSKKKVKERLKSNTIAINGQNSTKFDFLLNIGDVVEIGVITKKNLAPLSTLEILYQDSDIIAINKPAGLLSVGTTTENKNHALAILRKQLSSKTQKVSLFPVHRLDRETSGILLFATSKETREAVMDRWKESKKYYLAIVNGSPKEQKGTIDQPLRLDDKEYKMLVGKHPLAKFALTHYEVKKTTPTHTMLQIEIETGRQHQIRAHLAWLGNSIVNDERYEKGYKKGARMGLHALKLTIFHPHKKEPLTFEVDAPFDFYNLLK